MKHHQWWRPEGSKNNSWRRLQVLSDMRMSAMIASQGSRRVNSQNKLTHLLPFTPENRSKDDQAGTKVLEEGDSQI